MFDEGQLGSSLPSSLPHHLPGGAGDANATHSNSALFCYQPTSRRWRDMKTRPACLPAVDGPLGPHFHPGLLSAG